MKEPTDFDIEQARDRCLDDGINCIDCPFSVIDYDESEFWGSTVREYGRECAALPDQCPNYESFLIQDEEE